MSEPVKKRDGWYVEIDEGLSGPWNSRAAAESISENNVVKAQALHHRALKDKKGPNK